MLVSVDDLQVRLAQALAHRYRVEHELGRGGMSLVYLAWDERHERYVALKVLRPELSAALGPERFQDEIKTLARLKHPFILKLHDSGVADGLLYYVMPHVEGETLRHRLVSQGRLTVADAARITQEVAEALDYAHRHDRIHRDIKPENILFEEGHAIVSDFGIALPISKSGRTTERRTGTDTVLGTVDYMSPEQEQKLALDGRTDIYSLGLVLYEMLTGELPGPDRGVDSLTGRRPEVPAEMVGLLRRMIARDPAKRFANAAELAAALAEFTGQARWDDRARRRKWLMSTATMVVGGFALVLWLGPRRVTSPLLDPTHLAVLYFDDLSPDSGLTAVAAGISEDLMDRLAGVSALQVISPNGVRPYRGRAVPPDSIAAVLGVGTMVSGSMTRSSGVLRVTVRLIDGRTGQLLHTRQVSRPFGELFALQDTITADITAFLRQRIGETIVLRERRAGATNVLAWESVRQADLLMDQGSAAIRRGDDSAATRTWNRADSLYRRARALDAQWSVPLVGRGRVAHAFASLLSDARPAAEARQALAQPPRRPRYEDEWIRLGLAVTDSALQLAPESAEAHELRGLIRYLSWLRGYATSADSLVASERDLRAAVQGAPRLARAWSSLSQLLRYTGRFAEAEEAAQQALEADAFLLDARAVHRTLFFSALNLERYEVARDWCARGRVRFPADAEFGHCGLRILGWSGRGRAAIHEGWRLADSLERASSGQATGVYAADRRLLLAALYARTGLADSATALVDAARHAAAEDSTAAWFLFAESNVRLLLGDRRAALELIRRGLVLSPQLRDYVSRAAWFAALRTDPDFVRLVASG